ncbi:energy transducer TonB [Rapidithrix thailandica]|uniref:Energy transducer TonB n=1 Tax=Rapidithrix thailandica TaxID=413964 RepID=A0AAW9SDJ9_9BACT
MKSTSHFLLLLFLLISVKAFSQGPLSNYELGYFFDANAQMIDGYFDVDYVPQKSLEVAYTLGKDYTPGYYYDLGNNKIQGFLKYAQYNTFFQFRSYKEGIEKTIKPKECSSYVIGVDSFTVIENFTVERQLTSAQSNKREFAEVMEQVGSLTFYKHIRAGASNVVTTYLVKADSSNAYISFPQKPLKFKKVASAVFGEYTSLKERIEAGHYTCEDVPVLIKLLKYKRKHDRNEKIYFNKAWDEVNEPEKAFYYALTESVEDSVFHQKFYFNDGTLIYEGDFTSFFPHKRKGRFSWYYPDGSLRKKMQYYKNKPLRGVTYHPNGQVHREFRFMKEEPVYELVQNLDGKNLLHSSGRGIETFYDSIAQRQITYEFEDFKIKNAYFQDENGKKVYQTCKRNAKIIGFKIFQNRLSKDLSYPDNALLKNIHGYVFIKCIVEPDGLVSDIQILKGLTPDCNRLIKTFLSKSTTEVHWKPAKVRGKNVAQEVVLPVDFSIKGFSRYRNHYWTHDNHWMHHHYHTVPMPTITVPAGF